MNDTIFTKIIKGEIPSYKIYEDEKTFAFLDIHPLAEGHVLVVPKTQVEYIWDLESSDYQALMDTVQKVGKHLREVMEAPYVGVEVIGVDVPHAHVHVVPFTTTGDLHRTGSTSDEPDHENLTKVAEKVAFI
jgi:histidine triad (HIT) family protein